MIRKGFIRDIDGNWFTLHRMVRIVVTREDESYPNDIGMYWQIEAVYLINDEETGILIQGGFTHLNDAQNTLDDMMKDRE